MEKEMIGLNIEDGEEDIIHFSAMRNTMMNLWHILGGVQIS
ncbi:hypothetical protein Gotri_003911, partial [Gossypium trilobum]|nr:hypothetical protein [Gossypium trilobum]